MISSNEKKCERRTETKNELLICDIMSFVCTVRVRNYRIKRNILVLVLVLVFNISICD